jgi:hypothetical protein
LGIRGEIARKGVPAPVQADRRWVVERTHAWINGYGKLRRCTERDAKIVDFYLSRLSRFRWLAQHDAGAGDLGVS